jgi:hypothetical protein
MWPEPKLIDRQGPPIRLPITPFQLFVRFLFTFFFVRYLFSSSDNKHCIIQSSHHSKLVPQ